MKKNRVRERSFAECVEALIIANIKLTRFDHMKQEELAKPDPDLEKVAEWERGARSENERRAEARAAIESVFAEAVESGEYEALKEHRTFS